VGLYVGHAGQLEAAGEATIDPFGAPPLIYRAGRYGLGPHTGELLKAAGIRIDTSVRSLFDYSATNGPDYSHHPLAPYWVDREQRLLERIALTPEGVSIAEAIRGIDIAVESKLPVLVLSFHSPTLAPGHTPYAADAAAVEALYEWFTAIYAALGQRGVRSVTVGEIIAAAQT